VIKTVKMFEGDFKGQRTAYSANCMFIAILTNLKVKYDLEAIGEAIYPDGFGTMDPPGPSSGFGAIVLTDEEEDGKVVISDLKDREDLNGKRKSERAIKKSLKDYFDGFFVVEKTEKCMKQISFKEFYKLFIEDSDYKIVHFCEFAPD
jgi:hypothetical protein